MDKQAHFVVLLLLNLIPVKFNRDSLYIPEIAPLKLFKHTGSKMFLNPPRETVSLGHLLR